MNALEIVNGLSNPKQLADPRAARKLIEVREAAAKCEAELQATRGKVAQLEDKLKELIGRQFALIDLLQTAEAEREAEQIAAAQEEAEAIAEAQRLESEQSALPLA